MDETRHTAEDRRHGPAGFIQRGQEQIRQMGEEFAMLVRHERPDRGVDSVEARAPLRFPFVRVEYRSIERHAASPFETRISSLPARNGIPRTLEFSFSVNGTVAWAASTGWKGAERH